MTELRRKVQELDSAVRGKISTSLDPHKGGEKEDPKGSHAAVSDSWLYQRGFMKTIKKGITTPNHDEWRERRHWKGPTMNRAY